VGAVAGEAVHFARLEERFVDSIFKLITVATVASFTGGDGAFVNMRLVSGVNVVAGSAGHCRNGVLMRAGFDLLHRADVALFTELVDSTYRWREGCGMRGVAACTPRGILTGFSRFGMHRPVEPVGLTRMAASAGVLSRTNVQWFNRVRIGIDAVTSVTSWRFPRAGCKCFTMKAALEAMPGIFMAGVAVYLLVALEVRSIFVVGRLNMAVHARKAGVDAPGKRGR